MSENTGDTPKSGLSRRDALKAGGAAAAGAMFLGAMSAGEAGAATTPWQQADYLNFAKFVNAVWKKPSLRTQYQNDPPGTLALYGITLPPGVPPPTVPAKPATALGYSTTGSKAFRTKAVSSAEGWNLQVNPALGISISSLACVACPVSSFSSLSN